MKIQLGKQAKKFLERQEVSVRQRIINAISRLPYDGDIKQLKGEEGWRLRVGDYRIIYYIRNDTVIIDRIGPRGDVYKGGKRK